MAVLQFGGRDSWRRAGGSIGSYARCCEHSLTRTSLASTSIAFKAKQKEAAAALKKAQEGAKKGGPLVTGGSEYTWIAADLYRSELISLARARSQEERQEVGA